MKRRSFLSRAAASISAAVVPRRLASANSAAGEASCNNGPSAPEPGLLPFRALLASYGHPKDQAKGNFWNNDFWNRTLTQWSQEGFNVVIWLGPSEVSTGDHALIRFQEFPEPGNSHLRKTKNRLPR